MFAKSSCPGKNPAKTPKRMAMTCGRSAQFQSARPRGWRQRCVACGARNLGALVADRCFVGDHGPTIGGLTPAAHRNFRSLWSGKFAFHGRALPGSPPVRLSGPDRRATRCVPPLCYKPRGTFIADSTEMHRQNACCTSEGGSPVRGTPPCCPALLRRAMSDTAKSNMVIS
jgi:hypothetical protein